MEIYIAFAIYYIPNLKVSLPRLGEFNCNYTTRFIADPEVFNLSADPTEGGFAEGKGHFREVSRSLISLDGGRYFIRRLGPRVLPTSILPLRNFSLGL